MATGTRKTRLILVTCRTGSGLTPDRHPRRTRGCCRPERIVKEQLIERIKLTNNGYIFAPSGPEWKAAKANPELFKISGYPSAAGFNSRIALAKP